MKDTMIGVDLAKDVFQLHGATMTGEVKFRKKLARRQFLRFMAGQAPAFVVMEACGSAHYWFRELVKLGHEVKLIAPQYVRPFVKRQKNDAADAEAIVIAARQPEMRFVPVKTVDDQAALMLISVRTRLIANRTQLANAIRGYANEFGISAAKGLAHIPMLLGRIKVEKTVPEFAQELFMSQAEEYAELEKKIADVEAKVKAWQRNDERSIRLNTIPGIGPIGSALLIMKTPAPELFQSARQFAAWIGLTPKDHSTGGKLRLGGITRAGDEALGAILVKGATAVIHHARRSGKASRWLAELLRRKPPKLAAVALANKMARIAWKLMVSGETYSARSGPALKYCAT
jgi:transposase